MKMRPLILVCALLTIGSSGCGIRHRGPAASTPRASTPTVPAPRHRPAPTGKIRIGMTRFNGASALTVTPLSDAVLKDAAGKKLRSLKAGKPVKLAVASNGEVSAGGAQAQELSISGGMLQIAGHQYPGTMQIKADGAGLELVNELDIEQYLQGVLPGELPRNYLPEAQKALAVAARTYALVQHGKHGDFDLCSGTHCQMYVGYRKNATRGLAAVKATRRQCLWSGPDLAYTFYEADCGGLSTRAEEVPLKDKPAEPLPYLREVRDAPPGGPDYCEESPFHHWHKQLTRDRLEEKLNSRPETEIGKLLVLQVTGFDRSGRVTAVRLLGQPAAPASNGPALFTTPATRSEKTVTGWDLRNAIGALTLKSTRMKVSHPEQDTWVFTGSGFGHGLGLCQIGANEMAKRGFNYREILAHYYPGTRLAALPVK